MIVSPPKNTEDTSISFTNGPIGVVLSAWSVRADSLVDPDPKVPGHTPITVIASENAPKFDIREPNQALRFATFLLHLRHIHAPRLAKRFDEARAEFMKRWDNNDPSLKWTMQGTDDEHAVRFTKEMEGRKALPNLFPPKTQIPIYKKSPLSERAGSA
ncbi:hypothetical protein CYLTODRAFT_441114 [Cylindrobasidium torrendii FP15055 ss-10]|uniref:Uncharacterized protein n=1 Tax=Cylindrobasidium torrendii FP15055 ss-10 TaxID=1314674 RepID=A0A0D7BN34_9AGAR|nr:hypothetical protein CYLTODRAFT_441114 [Cylindrobasidium torrendii FP15055 ss-10]